MHIVISAIIGFLLSIIAVQYRELKDQNEQKQKAIEAALAAIALSAKLLGWYEREEK